MLHDPGIIAQALVLMGWQHDEKTNEWAHDEFTFGAFVSPRTAELVVGIGGFAKAFVEVSKQEKLTDNMRLVIERLWCKSPHDRGVLRDLFPEYAESLDQKLEWSPLSVTLVRLFHGCIIRGTTLHGIGKIAVHFRSSRDAVRGAVAHLSTLEGINVKPEYPNEEECFLSFSSCGRFAIVGMSRRGPCVLHHFDTAPGQPVVMTPHKSPVRAREHAAKIVKEK